MSTQRIESQSKPQLLRTALLDTLQRGKMKVGDRLPSEPELIAQYGVSRATVREALISLEQEGWVRRLQGKGTFVSERPKVHKTLGIIAPYLYATDSPDFRAGTDVIPILIQSIEHNAQKHGMNLMLFLDNLEIETERENMLNVIERGVDGLLMIYIGGNENLDCLEKIQSAGIPLILVDRYIEEPPIESVVTDNFSGAFTAVQRFIERGFSHVTFITAPIDSTTLRDRLNGYTAAMNQHGLPLDIRELLQGVNKKNDRACEIVSDLDFPSAIFSSDATRLALIAEQIENRWIPSKDYALGCFDEPYLTFPEDLLFVKVLQPLREIGRTAVERILARLQGNSADNAPIDATPIKLPPEILTTGPKAR
jgi:DNA-binding LacI/PurR family transcriptional regulator